MEVIYGYKFIKDGIGYDADGCATITKEYDRASEFRKDLIDSICEMNGLDPSQIILTFMFKL